MTESLGAFVCFVGSFIAAFVLFPRLIRALLDLKAGQVIQDELPESHQKKAGTPTAGGAVFIAVGLAAAALALVFRQPGVLAPLLALLVGGVIGFADDLVKLREGWLGIPARFKFPIQVLLAIPVAAAAHRGPQLLLPIDAWPVYLPLAVLAIVGTANAVNLTDGMDGLAGTLSLIALAGLVFLAPRATTGGEFVAAALCGSLLAFLLYNRYPARIFMGDTGSLALGYALAALAIEQRLMVLLPLLGLPFVIETLSVIIQVAYFKATHGRRIFKMTPIHYTFRLEGWSENRIVLAFGTVGTVTAVASALLARAW